MLEGLMIFWVLGIVTLVIFLIHAVTDGPKKEHLK